MTGMRKGYFSANRKLIRKFSLLFWLTALFCSMTAIVSSVSNYYQQQEADRIYGKWTGAFFDVSAENLKEIRQNPMFESAGTQNTFGMVIGTDQDEREIQYGNIGFADSAFFDMAGLQMKMGKMPDQENEIAVEASVLDAMGISYEIGQEIELEIRTDAERTKTERFVLSGVIENYSQFWNGGPDLVNFFTNGPSYESFGARLHVFVEPVSGYQDALLKYRLGDQVPEANINRFRSKDPFSDENRVVTLSVILSLILCAVISAEILFSWIWKRMEEIRLIRIAGIQKKVLMRDIGKMLVLAGRWPLAMLITFLVLCMSSELTVLLLLLVLILVGTVYGFTCLMIRNIPLLKADSVSGPKAVTSIKKRKSGTQITVKEAANRFCRRMKKTRVLQTACLILLQISLLYLGNRVHQSLKIMGSWNQSYVLTGKSEDRILFEKTDETTGLKTISMINDWETIPSDILEEFNRSQDLTLSNAYGMHGSASVTWNAVKDSLLYDSEKGMLNSDRSASVRTDKDGSTGFYPLVLEISRPEDLESILKETDEGMPDRNAFMSGKEAVVYLPKMKESDEKDAKFGLNPHWNGTADPSIDLKTELVFEKNGQTYSIPVTGIIREYDQLPFNLTPYTILTGGSEVNRVELDLKNELNRVPAELWLSRIASQNQLSFSNRRNEQTAALASHRVRILMSLFGMLVISSAVYFILSLSSYELADREQNYLSAIERAGVSRKICRKIQSEILISDVKGQAAVCLAVSMLWILSAFLNEYSFSEINFQIIFSAGAFFAAAGAGLLSAFRFSRTSRS